LRFHLLEELEGAGLVARGKIGERTHSARGIGCGRAQELGKLMRRTRVEAAIRAARQPRDFAERLFGDRIGALLEHESWHPEQPELTCGVTEMVELLLHGIAHEYQGLDLPRLGLALGMRNDLADLGVAASAIDPLHEAAEPLGLRNPARGP